MTACIDCTGRLYSIPMYVCTFIVIDYLVFLENKKRSEMVHEETRRNKARMKNIQ